MSSSDLLHLVWSSLGPSILLQMALFCSFHDWVIFHCIYAPHLLFPFLCWWTLKLFPCLGCCKQGCSEHWRACIFSKKHLLNACLCYLRAGSWGNWARHLPPSRSIRIRERDIQVVTSARQVKEGQEGSIDRRSGWNQMPVLRGWLYPEDQWRAMKKIKPEGLVGIFLGVNRRGKRACRQGEQPTAVRTVWGKGDKPELGGDGEITVETELGDVSEKKKNHLIALYRLGN